MDDEILDSSNDTKDDDESGDDDSDVDDGDDKSDQICISFLDLTLVDILLCLGHHKTFLQLLHNSKVCDWKSIVFVNKEFYEPLLYAEVLLT